MDRRYCGTLREEITNYLTAGETDGTTHIAWKITTNANAVPQNNGFATPPLLTLYSGAAASQTISCELLASATLTTQDVYLTTSYMGSALTPLATVFSAQADSLAGGVSLTAGAGTGAWNGLPATPVSSKVANTFTPNTKGHAMSRLFVTKASTTLYINPITT